MGIGNQFLEISHHCVSLQSLDDANYRDDSFRSPRGIGRMGSAIDVVCRIGRWESVWFHCAVMVGCGRERVPGNFFY